VYSVEDVVGHVQGTAQERKYSHFNCFKSDGKNSLVYQLSLKKSPVRPGADSYLQISYPRDGGLPVTEILSLKLICTNGDLPENLRVGDISQATSSSPEFADFTNIMQPTFGVYPPFGKNLLWRLLAHLNLNYVSLSSADNLKALLDIYLFPETRDRTGLLANKKRIDGIEKVTSTPANRLVSALILRGQDISVKARSDHFAGEGDFYLFGCVLDEFFGLYSSLNAYSRFTLQDSFKGETYQWPARTGEHPLI
jgi:type VI secretion system protein ImpG